MRIDHGGFYITVTQEFLNRPDVVVSLQKMAGITVTKGMASGALEDLRPVNGGLFCLADVAFVKMIPARYFFIWDEAETPRLTAKKAKKSFTSVDVNNCGSLLLA